MDNNNNGETDDKTDEAVKQCMSCSVFKPINEFGRKTYSTHSKSMCLACEKEYNAQRYLRKKAIEQELEIGLNGSEMGQGSTIEAQTGLDSPPDILGARDAKLGPVSQPKPERCPDAKGWRPAYFDNLVTYHADPSDQRTRKEFAAQNGVHPSTVAFYEKHHSSELFSLVDKVRANEIPKIRSAAFKAVFANISKSHLDRKLALQLTGDLVEKTENTTEIKTADEKRAMVADIIARLSGNKAVKTHNLPDSTETSK